jgi:hypothetical protein
MFRRLLVLPAGIVAGGRCMSQTTRRAMTMMCNRNSRHHRRLAIFREAM